MIKTIVFAVILVIFSVATFWVTHDTSLTVILLLAGSIIITALAMPRIQRNLYVDHLDEKIHVSGSKKMARVLNGYNLKMVLELENFKEVQTFFLASCRKHDTTEYINYMSKSLVISGIVYIFLTIEYIVSFISITHPDATVQEMLATKFGYTMGYLGVVLGYVCYYISPILLYSRKNKSVGH